MSRRVVVIILKIIRIQEQRILFKAIIKNDGCCKCEARLFAIRMTSGKNFQVKLAIVVAVVVVIDSGNDPASWHIISTSACCQSDDPIAYPEFDNDSDSDNELIKKWVL